MRNVEMALPQLDYKLVKITFLIWLKIKDPEAIANKAYTFPIDFRSRSHKQILELHSYAKL